jgi:hypothetical protein
MKGTTEPPLTPGQMKWLTDDELEQELAIAALNTRRPERFELLENERRRRRRRPPRRPKRRLLGGRLRS